MVFLSPNWGCQSAEGNPKHWCQPEKANSWTSSFLDPHIDSPWKGRRCPTSWAKTSRCPERKDIRCK